MIKSVAKISEANAELIRGTEYTNGILLNPIQDVDDNWIISLQEAQYLDISKWEAIDIEWMRPIGSDPSKRHELNTIHKTLGFKISVQDLIPDTEYIAFIKYGHFSGESSPDYIPAPLYSISFRTKPVTLFPDFRIKADSKSANLYFINSNDSQFLAIYEIEYADNYELTNSIINQSTARYIYGLLPNTIYYLRYRLKVRYKNNLYTPYTNFSIIKEFTTKPEYIYEEEEEE